MALLNTVNQWWHKVYGIQLQKSQFDSSTLWGLFMSWIELTVHSSVHFHYGDVNGPLVFELQAYDVRDIFLVQLLCIIWNESRYFLIVIYRF